ncbi:TerD family protein [Streptomyces sp. NPDC046887]|uniref:TerD family protein n=1 Tax=Streptomyces sp. NPDC046887 TaxID=3155472 RepID=UPI0034058A4A
MTAELVRGQNLPLPHTRLEVRVSAGAPVVCGATLADAAGRLSGAGRFVHPGAPRLPGVEVPETAATEHRLVLDLDALAPEAHRLTVLLALPGGAGDPGAPACFGALAPPRLTVGVPDGDGIATYSLTGLETESAVAALELYRRQGAWKVRAVGQGYAGGLADMLADQGLPPVTAGELAAAALAAAVPTAPPATAQPTAAPVALGPAVTGPPPPRTTAVPLDRATTDPAATGATAQPPAAASGPTIDYLHPRRSAGAPSAGTGPQPSAPATTPAVPVAGDAAGWTMDERLYNQVWGMFEDLARTTAAYRSAIDFADSRREQELDRALADPRARIGSAGDAARAAAGARYEELSARARETLDRDLAQLTAESEAVEPALPPAYARWDHPVWLGYRPPAEPAMAVRLGDLHLPERPELRIPMLIRLPLERGLWIDSGRGGSAGSLMVDATEIRRLAAGTAALHAVRLLAAHPPGGCAAHLLDPGGSAASAFAPLTAAGLVTAPPAQGAAGVTEVLDRLVRRVELVRMAVRAGAADALPPDIDPVDQLLVVNDFPYGFDDRSVTRLRYLADEGPAVGVHVLLVADRTDAAAYGPVLDPLWSSLLRLTPVPDEHLADPWVGHAWTYEPPTAPAGGGALARVLGELGSTRR